MSLSIKYIITKSLNMTNYDEMKSGLNFIIQNIKHYNYVLPLDKNFLISFKHAIDYAYDNFDTQIEFENALIELKVKNAKNVVSSMIKYNIVNISTS